MVDVRSVIASFFIMLKQDLYVLIRIESLVALVTLLFLVMFAMDVYRCRSRSSILTTILKTLDGLSDHIVVYLLGAMQSADFDKQLFPVWAIVLVGLRISLGYLSGYNIADRERRVTEVSNVMKFIAAGVLNGTRALDFTKPLWSLWTILTLRSIYRFWAHSRAVKSLWHGRSSEFLPEYLRLRLGLDDQHDRRNNLDNSENYLVYGETDQKINIKKPEYVLHLNVTNPNSLITLDKVRACSLSSSNSSRYNDMTLAFSLSRLLRCRLEDVPLHPDSTIRTRHLITSRIICNQDQQAESDTTKWATRAFNILELELAFTRDYFCTLYPVVFWRGLLSLSLNLLQSIATFAVALWLAVDISSLLTEKEGVEIRVNGFNVDLIATWVFLSIMMFKEVWEMVTYLLSNWTRLLLVCNYVQNQCLHITDTGLTECLISSFFSSKLADPWHGRIDQYEFLQSCTYKPTFWKMAHAITLGKTPQKLDGRRAGNTIKIPECVKVAVLEELRRLDLNGQQLQRDIRSLWSPHTRFERYEWALFMLSKCSQSILVWHIVTSLCEIKLAKDRNIDLSKPSFLRSVWSWLKELVCRSSQPFLVDENISLEGKLQINYRIANSLSRYCAYLVVSQPELLPDSFIMPEVIFETTLDYARNKLKDCESTRCRYDKLMAIAQEAVQDSEPGKLDKNIVQQGAMLAKDLMDNEDEKNRWKILAGVWTKLLVQIAPSWNAEAHKNCLESGGEFITLIWALFWHCGISKSCMWDDGRAPESPAQAPQGNTTETRSTQFAEEQGNEDENGISEEHVIRREGITENPGLRQRSKPKSRVEQGTSYHQE